jgi:hypothetical protein
MASSGKVVINIEDLRDGDGTLRRALELWSSRNDPVNYEQWRSLFSQLARMREPKSPDRKMLHEIQEALLEPRKIREMFQEIQEAGNHLGDSRELHGGTTTSTGTASRRPLLAQDGNTTTFTGTASRRPLLAQDGNSTASRTFWIETVRPGRIPAVLRLGIFLDAQQSHSS